MKKPNIYFKVLEFEKFRYFKIDFALVDDRPQFEHGIVCPNCGELKFGWGWSIATD